MGDFFFKAPLLLLSFLRRKLIESISLLAYVSCSWCEGSIEEVFVTMDCHQPNHIAHARVWTDENGNEPPAFQQIRYADVESGVWRPKDPSLLVRVALSPSFEYPGSKRRA